MTREMCQKTTVQKLGLAAVMPAGPLSFLASIPPHQTDFALESKAGRRTGQNSTEPDMPPEAVAYMGRVDAENAWAMALARLRAAEAKHAEGVTYKTLIELHAARRHADAMRPGIFRVVK